MDAGIHQHDKKVGLNSRILENDGFVAGYQLKAGMTGGTGYWHSPV